MKGKISPIDALKAYRGSRSITPRVLKLALDGGEWLSSRPGRFTPGKNIGTQLIGDGVGPRTRCFEEVLGFETRTAKTVVAIPATLM